MRQWAIGDRLFLASGGVASVKGYAARGPGGKPAPWDGGSDPAFYVVESADKVACIPISQAGQTLRPLLSAAQAADSLAVLRGPDIPISLKPILERGKDIAHSGTPLEHATFLRELYSLPVPLSDALAQGLLFFEALVLPELELVTGAGQGTLAKEMAERFSAAREAQKALAGG